MKRSNPAVAAGLAMLFASVGAKAALVNGSTLNINSGSYFEMECDVGGVFCRTDITGFNGLVLGTSQSASGSHSGLPDGTETPGIDQPWVFFGNTGMHATVSPTNVLSASGNTATISMSGWTWLWNGVSANLGGLAWGTNDSGVANVTCGVDCSNSDTYTLYYTATVAPGDPSSLGGFRYDLFLTGTVSAVPVPAALWLLSSGLLGLVRVARRRRNMA